MKKLILSFFFLTAVICGLHAQQAPSIEWQKCLGGSYWDYAFSIQQTIEGGFIVAGQSRSNDGDVSGNHGSYDYWIVKLDGAGNIVWQKSFGGSIADEPFCIKQINTGGYIVAGFSTSNDGDVSGNHEYYDDYWEDTINSNDYWIVKLDTSGNIEWQRSLGGIGNDQALSVQQTTDGGFIVAGFSTSNDGDVSGNHGGQDYWIVKLDADGNLMWQKALGGSVNDRANSVHQTIDGGFIVAGYSYSDDGDISGNHYGADYWIVKLDTSGSLVWQKCLGGNGTDHAYCIQQTSDGGFIVAGYSFSNDGDVTGNHGLTDCWAVKLDTDGNLEWQKCLGGSGGEGVYFIEQTTDGGFIIAASSISNDGDVTGNHGYHDWWIVRLDTVGNLVWQECLGGSYWDEPNEVQQTFDGGFIIAGYAFSNDGDVSGVHGYADYWIVKLSPEIPTAIPSLSTASISLHPNPVQNLLTITLATQAANATIRVYDLQGKIITLPTTIQNTQAQLNTEKLPDGFYTLQIINNKTGEIEVGKFVKQ